MARVPAVRPRMPMIVPLGDSAVLVRFSDRLDERANKAAIALVRRLETHPIIGVVETVPNLVSVLLRYEHGTDPDAIGGELRLRLRGLDVASGSGRHWSVPVTFDGPDLEEVAAALSLSPAEFIKRHNAGALRVLATGFAPGFVYCGMHEDALHLPRRTTVRSAVPPGSVLFAAGQTAITATEMPTGWHVIGHTSFRNFDPQVHPPTRLEAGDVVEFEAV